VTEPFVAESLAAVAAGCGVAGLALAVPGSRIPRGWARHADHRHLWMAGFALIGAVTPGPKLLTMPLALLLGGRIRRLGALRADARRRRAMDAEIP
jgi:hypothetical protein